MVCLGFEPGSAGWKTQTNTLSYLRPLESQFMIDLIRQSKQQHVIKRNNDDMKKINFELKTKVWRWFKDNFNVNIRVTYFDSIKALPLPLLGSSQVVEYSLKTLIFL